MAGNFDFLCENSDYSFFSAACIDAERMFSSSPTLCAIACRRALELAVKWVYSADSSISYPAKLKLHSLINEPSFRFAVDYRTWEKIIYIAKLGNLAAHNECKISDSGALLSLMCLFEFVGWIDFCYGANYIKRDFSAERINADTQSRKDNSESKDTRRKIEQIKIRLSKLRDKNACEKTFCPESHEEFMKLLEAAAAAMPDVDWTTDEIN